MAPRSIPRPLVVAALLLSTAVAAEEPSPLQSPAPIATRTPTPDPTIAVPLALTPRPGIDDVPAPVFVPNPRPTPTPTPARSPVASAPTAAAGVAPVAGPTPAPSATGIVRPPIETVILSQPRVVPPWVGPALWLVGGAAILMIVLGCRALWRQRDAGDDDGNDAPFEAALPPEPVAEPVSAGAGAGDRARLAVALRATRAGLNLISATAECEVTVANIGGTAAENAHATLRLMSARDGQEAELTAFHADTGGRPATPVFTLAPGEERRFRAVTALPHDAIHSIDAGGRPMFVPLVALSVRYRDAQGPRRIGQAFMLGIDQGGSAKLAPFWLDGPARGYDNVATRPHGETVER